MTACIEHDPPTYSELDSLVHWACPSHTSDETCATLARMSLKLLGGEETMVAIKQAVKAPALTALRRKFKVYKMWSARNNGPREEVPRVPGPDTSLPRDGCPICLSETLQDPIQLGCPCGKAFCGPCIKHTFSRGSTEVGRRRLCPACLQPARHVQALSAAQELGRQLASVLGQAERVRERNEEWRGLMTQAALLLAILAVMLGRQGAAQLEEGEGKGKGGGPPTRGGAAA